jgi:hypothetical protein
MVGYAACRASTRAYLSLQTRTSPHRSFVDRRMQQFTVLPAVVGGRWESGRNFRIVSLSRASAHGP